jgi:hypothetical protein
MYATSTLAEDFDSALRAGGSYMPGGQRDNRIRGDLSALSEAATKRRTN